MYKADYSQFIAYYSQHQRHYHALKTGFKYSGYAAYWMYS